MDDETSVRLWRLEARLEEHLEALNEAVDQRDKVALNAAWSIVRAVCVLAAFAVASAADRWLNWPSWASFLVFAAVFFTVLYWTGGYAERGEEQDADKLRRLPVWQPDYPEAER